MMKNTLLTWAAVVCAAVSSYGNAARAVSVEMWRATELVFEAGADYDATGADAVTFDAVFTHESGEKVSRPGFWDGGKTFRVARPLELDHHLPRRWRTWRQVWHAGGKALRRRPRNLQARIREGREGREALRLRGRHAVLLPRRHALGPLQGGDRRARPARGHDGCDIPLQVHRRPARGAGLHSPPVRAHRREVRRHGRQGGRCRHPRLPTR